MKKYALRSFGILTMLVILSIFVFSQCGSPVEAEKPNVIFILADDMGYGDLSCFGQELFETPNIDRLAEEGMRMTSCYAGSAVCGPSRSVLMTGQHMGHTRVRANSCKVGGTLGYKGERQVRRMNLLNEDLTVGNMMQDAGYRTGLVGKWHLGGYDPGAAPNNRGFDEFYGWLTSNGNTHNYYPTQRYRNEELYDIPENQDGKQGVYMTDKCTDEAISFIENNQDKPFFLYLAYNNPHVPLVVPDLGPYADVDWIDNNKIYAAMIHRLDQNIERLMQSLKDKGVDENTIVFFCSDNGPRGNYSKELTDLADFFDSNGPLRGYKRDLYEGGVRVPMIVRWPGKIKPGTESDVPWYFTDIMPTLADLVNTPVPEVADGVSVLPVLLEKNYTHDDRYLYWEFYEGGYKQSIRWNNWKGIRMKKDAALELYDLNTDLSEEHDIASEYPGIVLQIEEMMAKEHVDSENYPMSEY